MSKKVVLIILFLTAIMCSAKEPTVENVYQAILEEGIQKPRYVLAQSALETAWYESYNCRHRNNLFGFRSSSWITEGNSKGYKVFSSWEESIEYYGRWQKRRSYKKGEDYIKFLSRIGYAEDPEYGWKLQSVMKRIKKVYGI